MFITFMEYENPHRGACAARPLHRRQPSVNSIQIEADRVRVNVTVTDASGHLAPDLAKEKLPAF